MRYFFVGLSILFSNFEVTGQIQTFMSGIKPIAGDSGRFQYDKTSINIPAGKCFELLGSSGRFHTISIKSNAVSAGLERSATSDYGPILTKTYQSSPQNPTGRTDEGLRIVTGPNVVVFAYTGDLAVTYRIFDNPSSSSTKSASPKADDIKLTDEFLMLDYTVQANTTYKLGISRDLKKWEPLFEFTPESDKLNVELPKIILGNEAFLKLE